MADIIKLNLFEDKRGSLIPIEDISLPFKIKRVYFIMNVPHDSIRAGHAHKRNIQALVAIKGSCVISLPSEKFILDSPQKCLILYPEEWHDIYEFSGDCVLLALASEYYEEDDYIYDRV